MAGDPRALLQQADKLAASASGGFSLFGGKQDKWEQAADKYAAAANAFRLAKQMKEAGSCFEKAASIQTSKLNEPDDAANSMTEAFKSYRKSDPEDAARCLNQAITHYTSKGNFRRAATHKQNLAEMFEVELGDNKRALENYQTAAEWFENDSAEALANKLFLKAAEIQALEGEYYPAIQNFEKVAKSSVNNNLMKWSVKEYLMKAGTCHLATGDLVGTRKALESYKELDNTFQSTRECQLLDDLSNAVEQGDPEGFADKLFAYDQMSKLDKWKTTLFLRIKNTIQEQGEDFS